MQADSYSTGRDHLCPIVMYPRWLRVRVGRILADEVFCSWVRGRRCFDLDFCGFIHRACSLALPAMSQTLCQIQCLLASKVLAVRPRMLDHCNIVTMESAVIRRRIRKTICRKKLQG